MRGFPYRSRWHDRQSRIRDSRRLICSMVQVSATSLLSEVTTTQGSGSYRSTLPPISLTANRVSLFDSSETCVQMEFFVCADFRTSTLWPGQNPRVAINKVCFKHHGTECNELLFDFLVLPCGTRKSGETPFGSLAVKSVDCHLPGINLMPKREFYGAVQATNLYNDQTRSKLLSDILKAKRTF